MVYITNRGWHCGECDNLCFTKHEATRCEEDHNQLRLAQFGIVIPTEKTTMAEQTTTQEWEVKGWMNASKSGNGFTFTVNNTFIGVVSKAQAERLLKGEVKGIPIKMPPAKEPTDGNRF